ncbi:MAG: hypothetical protein PHV85_04395 [Desulfovibrionaceae bacterium]|nr:hypothetical protein [Desulfovibrionaceae bacterium]
MADKNIHETIEYMAKGILIGGSLGAVAGWFFMDFGRALGLGMLCGCLAGLSFKGMRDRKK